MSLRSDYRYHWAAGEDVSAHPGRPGPDPEPATGPAVLVVSVYCDQCGVEAYHRPDQVPPDRQRPGVLHLCDGQTWGVWRRRVVPCVP